MAKKKTDLYAMHENVAAYLQSILKLHSGMLVLLQERLDSKELDAIDFNYSVRQVTLAPAVLTVITSFLKTNEVVVLPDTIGEDLSDYEKQCEKFRKQGTSVKDLDVQVDVN